MAFRIFLSVCLLVLVAAVAPEMAGAGYDPLKPRGAPESDAPAVPTNPDFDDLPDTPGVEDTFYLCTACHSAAIIKQQSISDARWDYLWDWMIEKQGMAEVDEETKQVILDYLKTHFSSER